ncbi:MAG TPA: hypothetical protein VK864_06375 [Longimicrobiales bacterium]|nr:hypothetical protein [Longimicrobiales bacterium]
MTVESAQFRTGLGEPRRKNIESTIANEVSASLTQQFPVVDWWVTADAGTPAGRLIAAITERPTDMLPEVNLEWRAEIEGKSLRMPSVFPQPLYSGSNAERPVHDDRGAFLKLLRDKVVGWVQSETNSEHLRVEFLRYVPLATSVTVPPGQRLVVVPVPWQAARLSERAVLLVSYRGSDTGTPEQMRVMLTGLAPRLTDPLLGNTQSQVDKCTRGGAPIDAAQLWGTCVDPLSRNPQQTLVVRVDDYIYDANPDVQDGVILDEN